MKHPFKLTCLLAMLALLSACAPSVVPTPMPQPTASATFRASFTPMPGTPAPVPSPTIGALPCPPGYGLHVDTPIGFSACYPAGWLVWKQEDEINALQRVDFTVPMPDNGTRTGLRFVSITVSPGTIGSNEDEFLQSIAKWLTQEPQQEWLARPQMIRVDGWRAVDAGYEGTVVFGREVVGVTRWVTAFWANDKQWIIEVVGRSDYRQELEEIHNQFLPYFHLLPL